MTQNQTINTGLLTIGALFLGLVPQLVHDNFWYGVVSAFVGIGAFAVYELLP